MNAQDLALWRRNQKMLNRRVRKLILETPVGAEMAVFQDAQVELITSLPLEAARRVQEKARANLIEGKRFSEIIIEGLTPARATLIARTETAKASAILMQVRAMRAGSSKYIWWTANDGNVRASHKALEGTTQRWDNPPGHEEGGGRIYYSHPGQIFNCRCFAAPLFED